MSTFVAPHSRELAGHGHSITDKHHADIALKNSEGRLVDAQELAHLGSWDENHETGILYWSDECKKIFGYNIEDQVDQGMFWNIVHPEEVDELRETWGKIEKTMKSL